MGLNNLEIACWMGCPLGSEVSSRRSCMSMSQATWLIVSEAGEHRFIDSQCYNYETVMVRLDFYLCVSVDKQGMPWVLLDRWHVLLTEQSSFWQHSEFAGTVSCMWQARDTVC
jgi:hypothetical protein